MILPKHVSREYIFAMVEQMLKQHEFFSNVISIENAFVPVIKFTYANVDVKLVFAVLQLPVVPSDDRVLLHDDTLEGMDDHSQRSLNGWRVCKYMLDHVPDVDLFRDVLAEIWQWARNRLVYSTNCGYLGGTVWAIMLAKVCGIHRHTDMTPRHLIQAFFNQYANWDWRTPVAIQEEVVGFEAGNQYMPVLSPVSPYPNVAFNVTRTTFDFIKDALKETHESLQGVRGLNGAREVLVIKTDPSDLYKSFVGIMARVPEPGRLKAWRSAVESQFVELNKELDQDYQRCRRAQIFPRCYVSRDGLECTWILCVDFVGGPHDLQFLFYIERFRQNLYVRHQVSTPGPHHENTLTVHCWTKCNVDLLLRSNAAAN